MAMQGNPVRALKRKGNTYFLPNDEEVTFTGGSEYGMVKGVPTLIGPAARNIPNYQYPGGSRETIPGYQLTGPAPAAPAAAEVAQGVGPSSNITTPLEPFYGAPREQRRTQTATATRRPGIGGMVTGVTVTSSAMSQQDIPAPRGISPDLVVRVDQMLAGAQTPEARAAAGRQIVARLTQKYGEQGARELVQNRMGRYEAAAVTRPTAGYYKAFDLSTDQLRGETAGQYAPRLERVLGEYKGDKRHPQYVAAAARLEALKPIVAEEKDQAYMKTTSAWARKAFARDLTPEQWEQNLAEGEAKGLVSEADKQFVRQRILAAQGRRMETGIAKEAVEAGRALAAAKAKVDVLDKNKGDREETDLDQEYAQIIQGLTAAQAAQVPRVKARAAAEAMVTSVAATFGDIGTKELPLHRDYVHAGNLKDMGVSRAEFLAGLRAERGEQQAGTKLLKDLTDDQLWGRALGMGAQLLWTKAPPLWKRDKNEATVRHTDPERYDPGTGEKAMWEGEGPTDTNPVRYVGLKKRLQQQFEHLRDSGLGETEARRAIVRALGAKGNERIWDVVYKNTDDAKLKVMMDESRKRAAEEFTAMSEIDEAHARLAQGDPTMAIDILKRHGRTVNV